MRIHLAVMSFALGSWLAGCASTLIPIAYRSYAVHNLEDMAQMEADVATLEVKEAVKKLARLAEKPPTINRDESSDEPLDLSPFPNTANPLATHLLLKKTPRGSFVHLIDNETHLKWVGTLNTADSKHVVLNDCLFSELRTGPNGEPQAVASFVRSLSIDVTALTHMRVFSVPSRKDEAELLCDRGRDDVVTGFVFVSGRTQPLSAVPPTGKAATQSLSQIALGSRIGWRDAANTWWEATLIDIENGEALVADCSCRTTRPGPHGEQQSKTSLIRSESINVSGLTVVSVLAPPAPDFGSKQNEDDCCDHCLEGIVFKSGRRMNIHLPTADDTNERKDAWPASSIGKTAQR